MSPLSTKVEFCRLYPKKLNYLFLAVFAFSEAFCYAKTAFSYSRVLLFPCSPHGIMVKNVVKTCTSKKHKWSPKNRSRHQASGSSRKKKTNREKQMWSARKQPTEICGHEEPKPRGQAMWTKAFESREENSHLKGFSSYDSVVLQLLLSILSSIKLTLFATCRSHTTSLTQYIASGMQGLKITFPLPK